MGSIVSRRSVQILNEIYIENSQFQCHQVNFGIASTRRHWNEKFGKTKSKLGMCYIKSTRSRFNYITFCNLFSKFDMNMSWSKILKFDFRQPKGLCITARVTSFVIHTRRNETVFIFFFLYETLNFISIEHKSII